MCDKEKTTDATIEKIINNKIYVGDYERYKKVAKEQEIETVVYHDVVVTRAMYEDV